MRIEFDHDDHPIVVRILDKNGIPTSAYIVPSWDNLHIFSDKPMLQKQLERLLKEDDEKLF